MVAKAMTEVAVRFSTRSVQASILR